MVFLLKETTIKLYRVSLNKQTKILITSLLRKNKSNHNLMNPNKLTKIVTIL
jgi:hypothetical protein